MAKYLSGTYTSTYTLTINPTTVTSTGVIHVNSTSAAGIIGTSGVAWTLTNLGTVESVGSASVGINLASGGLVTNGTSGSTAGYIDGTTTGIQISGATGTVVNYGRVSQTGAAGNNAINLGAGGTITNRGTISEAGSSNAINLGAGGGLTNGASGSTAGLITGLQGGINISGSAGTITNFGTVSQTSTAGNNAINLGAGGTITNLGTVSAAGTNASAVQFGVIGGKLINGTLGGTVGLITAYHLGLGFFPGAAVNPGTVTVVNYGTIVSTQTGTAAATGFSGLAVNFGTNSTGTIDNFGRIAGSQTAGGGAILLAGGVVTNEARGIIDGKGGNAVTSSTAGIAVTLTNFGTVQNASTTNSTVYLGHGGIVTNGATSSTGAAIVGTGTNSTSVAIKSATGTVNNFGTISDAGTFNSAIYIGAGGNVTNAASGRIVAAWTGVDVRNVAGTVNNLGTITSTATFVNSATAKAVGVVLEQGGTVINGAIGTTAGLIQAYELGVYIGGAFGTPHSGAVGLVFNYGTIASTGTGANAGAAVELSSGGTITNRGTIESVAGSAVVIKGTVAGAINNYGTIQDTGTIATAVVVSAGGTLTNRGLITSSAGAVSFTNTAGMPCAPPSHLRAWGRRLRTRPSSITGPSPALPESRSGRPRPPATTRSSISARSPAPVPPASRSASAPATIGSSSRRVRPCRG